MSIAARYVVTVDPGGPRMRGFREQDGGSRFEVFNGVDLRGATAAEVESRVDVDVVRSRYGRHLAAGEVGCALSHLALMAKIGADEVLNDADAVLVVEDDAILHEDLDVLLPWLTSHPFDLMPLHHGSASRLGLLEPEGAELMETLYPLSPLSRLDPSGRFRVGYTTPEAWMGTLGYVVRKHVAAHLARVDAGPLTRVADDYRVIGDHGIRLCQVRPSLIWESDEQTSVITGTGRVLGATDASDGEIADRMRIQADNMSLRRRKLAWLVGRDVASRLPWQLRHVRPVEAGRSWWNLAVPRMPPRVRHLVRPGVP